MRQPKCTRDERASVPLGVVPGCALLFLVSWANGRSITGDIYLNRRLSQIDPYGTWFRLSTPKTSAVIPNGQTGSTFLT